MAETKDICSFCGGTLEEVHTQLRIKIGDGLKAIIALPNDSHLTFGVPGEPTSVNPIKAFRQGIEELPDDRKYIARSKRYTKCARLELFAEEPSS